MKNNRQICTDYVLSLFKSGRPHFPMEIQENVIMTPTYETDFVICKYEL